MPTVWKISVSRLLYCCEVQCVFVGKIIFWLEMVSVSVAVLESHASRCRFFAHLEMNFASSLCSTVVHSWRQLFEHFTVILHCRAVLASIPRLFHCDSHLRDLFASSCDTQSLECHLSVLSLLWSLRCDHIQSFWKTDGLSLEKR